MIKKTLTVFSFIVSLTIACSAQITFLNKHQVFYLPTEPVYYTINTQQNFIDAESTRTFLQTNYLNNRLVGQTLELDKILTSPAGTHIRFKHVYEGFDVFQSFIQANYSNNGKLYSIIDAISKFEKVDMPTGTGIPQFWANSNYGLTPAYSVTSWDSSSNQPVKRIYNIENKLLLVYNTRLNIKGPDSMVTAMVYMPNPIVATNNNYGGKFVDNADKNNTELTNARTRVRVPLQFKNGKFILSDGLITILNFDDPPIPPVEPTDTFLNYTREMTGFEDINVFYHLHTLSKYLIKIGFGNLLDTLHVDTHALGDEDNSQFDPDRKPFRLFYGTGNVDDGEDGQVVIHEFGHSLSNIAATGTAAGKERLAMEEGQADYMAMSYSRSLSKNKPNDLFSWDGHNEFYAGFVTNTSRVYPVLNELDKDRELWSTALMCIYDKVGRTKSDSLILSFLFHQAAHSIMPDAARIILKMDTLLFNGKHVAGIWQCFTDREILDTVPWDLVKIDPVHPESDIKFYNTTEFTRGISPVRIEFKYPRLWNEIEIYNNLGQKIKSIPVSTETILQPEIFIAGVYYLKITSLDGRVSLSKKIIRQ